MNRIFKAVLAVVFICIIMFCAMILTQSLGGKIDLTENRIYSLSQGTKNILDKLNEKVTIKLYYAREATKNAPDAIQRYNDYFYFVKALLEEYEAKSGNKIELEVIDPKAYSDEEQEALRYGLRRFPINEDEPFFFGLVARMESGATESIEFFSPDRENFVEYDISSLLDKLMSRAKSRIGILSSLPVTGADMSDYMTMMRRQQGLPVEEPWRAITLLEEKYEVKKIDIDTAEIKDIDLLLVLHPKNLPEKALFAIDQFVVKGGSTIICVDPHSLADRPSQQQMMSGMTSQGSSLNALLEKWGVTIPEQTYAGDLSLAQPNPFQRQMARMPEVQKPLIGFMQLVKEKDCFNEDNIITSYLNDITIFFSGAIEKIETEASESPDKEIQIKIEPLITTSEEGNSWSPDNPYALMMYDSQQLLDGFTRGQKAEMIGCLITGRLESNYPAGIDVEVEPDAEETPDPNDDTPAIEHLDAMARTPQEVSCQVAVFADVDFISDMVAFRPMPPFGYTIQGDNLALLQNTIETLSGSSDLVAIRSRGNFRRPFLVVEEIIEEAARESVKKEEEIQEKIRGFQQSLQEIASRYSASGEDILNVPEFTKEKEEIEKKLTQATIELRQVQNQRREKIDKLESKLTNLNMFGAAAFVLLIAIVIWIRRFILRRHYLSKRVNE